MKRAKRVERHVKDASEVQQKKQNQHNQILVRAAGGPESEERTQKMQRTRMQATGENRKVKTELMRPRTHLEREHENA